jgi:hypothetical protein
VVYLNELNAGISRHAPFFKAHEFRMQLFGAVPRERGDAVKVCSQRFLKLVQFRGLSHRNRVLNLPIDQLTTASVFASDRSIWRTRRTQNPVPVKVVWVQVPPLVQLPEVKGFSERNIGRMIAFYREYTNPSDFLSQAAAKLASPENLPQAAAELATLVEAPPPAAPSRDSLLWSVPWFHHIVLMEKVKDRAARFRATCVRVPCANRQMALAGMNYKTKHRKSHRGTRAADSTAPQLVAQSAQTTTDEMYR